MKANLSVPPPLIHTHQLFQFGVQMSINQQFSPSCTPHQDATVLALDVFQRPDGSSLGPGFLGLGNTAIVLQVGLNALKIPKLRNLESAPESDYDTLLFNNEMNRDKLRNEVGLFQRLGSHPGIIRCLSSSEDGIELPLFTRGNLHNYIRDKERPSPSLASKWISSIADILCHCHERKVFLADIALRNILIDDDDNLVMIDFADPLHFLWTQTWTRPSMETSRCGLRYLISHTGHGAEYSRLGRKRV